MKKIFLSVPMKGRPDEAILNTIEKMKGIIKAYYPNEEIEFCHNYNPLLTKELEQTKKNMPGLIKNDSVWYLGEAIKVLAGCDELIEIGAGGHYYPVYSNGCVMEKSIALRYGIPTRTLPNFDGYFTPDIEKAAIEYNKAYETKDSVNKNVDTDVDGIPVYNGE